MSNFNSNQFNISTDGYYGTNQEFGGRYVPEMLIPALEELENTFNKYKNDQEFLAELSAYQINFVGRPSPLIFASNLTKQIGGAKIYLKNEGVNHTGSHKINHCLYQVLLAKRMGKTKVICETGAGQHGLATATVCAKFGMKCTVYMGKKDIQKQYPNVFFMKQLGAEVVSVDQGTQSLVDAVDMAIGAFIQSPDSYYMLGSAVGPAPYPEIMREAQSVISKETKQQLNALENKLPDVVVACIGGGSNAIGAFNEYLYEDQVRLVGVEAGGEGLTTANHASRLASHQATLGVMQGFKSYFLQDKYGQSIPTDSIASGLNYAGIGPIHAYLHSVGRLEISSVTNKEVLETFSVLAKSEGIIAALESLHAVVEGLKIAKDLSNKEIVLINLSGRGDNYLFNIAKGLGDAEFDNFISGLVS